MELAYPISPPAYIVPFVEVSTLLVEYVLYELLQAYPINPPAYIFPLVEVTSTVPVEYTIFIDAFCVVYPINPPAYIVPLVEVAFI